MNSQGATEFEPTIEWMNEDDCDTLLLYLPGFTKEQLRVQLRSRTLIISGQRRLQDNRLSLFRKEFPVAEHCDINKISAKFEGSILYVKQPRLTPQPAAKQEEKHQTDAPTPVPKNHIDEPKVQQEKVKYDSKPTSLRQPNRNDDVQNNMKDSPDKDLEENPVDDKKVQQEKTKNNAKDGPTKHVGEKDGNVKEEVGELKDPKGVSKNALKMRASGSGLVMKLKPSRNVVIKVLFFATGLLVGIYCAKVIQSLMAWE